MARKKTTPSTGHTIDVKHEVVPDNATQTTIPGTVEVQKIEAPTTALEINKANARLLYDNVKDNFVEKAKSYLDLTIKDENDKVGYKTLHDSYMLVKNAVTNTEKTRKALIKKYVDPIKEAIDEEAEAIEKELTPIRDELLKRRTVIDDILEEQENKRKEALAKRILDRTAQLLGWGFNFDGLKYILDPEGAKLVITAKEIEQLKDEDYLVFAMAAEHRSGELAALKAAKDKALVDANAEIERLRAQLAALQPAPAAEVAQVQAATQSTPETTTFGQPKTIGGVVQTFTVTPTTQAAVDAIQKNRLNIGEVSLPPDMVEFLDVLMQDLPSEIDSYSAALDWCVGSCMEIEKLYGHDACYVAYNDIRKPENQDK